MFDDYSWVLILILAIFVVMFAALAIGGKKAKKQQEAIDEEILSEPTPEPFAEYARVVSKRMEESYGGTPKMPRYKLMFIVTFLTDGGETKEFSVSEETYGRINEHQAGMLITIDGNFFDFGDGEEI